MTAKAILIILPMMLITGCVNPEEVERPRPGYLDFLCGTWEQHSAFFLPDGSKVSEGSARVEIRYIAGHNIYQETGQYEYDGEDSEWTAQYIPVSESNAVYHAMLPDESSLTGNITQINDHQVEVMLTNGATATSSQHRITFENNKSSSSGFFYNEAGDLVFKTKGEATRQNHPQ